jgi:hypothetical protein
LDISNEDLEMTNDEMRKLEANVGSLTTRLLYSCSC